jgi:hypothetical protein
MDLLYSLANIATYVFRILSIPAFGLEKIELLCHCTFLFLGAAPFLSMAERHSRAFWLLG